MVESRVIDLLRKYRAVLTGTFVLASGANSTIYIDVKTAMTHPELLQAIAAEISEHATGDCIAGVAVGGVPLAVATSLTMKLPYAIIRSSSKDHGTGGTIIGDVAGKRVLLVEDVTTSGGSALYGINELRKAGATVSEVVCVVDREQGAEEALQNVGATLISLSKVNQLVK
ncbi:MAG: orotate phosphoribosyltransferase [Methanospirillaceae archaeon]|nr:orotate phosphoribosyltransferase [Methanospirillaceae archaeon]